MVNGAFNLASGAGDLTLQCGEPGFQFGHGKRVQILPQQSRQRIVGLAWKIITQVHEM